MMQPCDPSWTDEAGGPVDIGRDLFPDDVISRLLRRLVRFGGPLDPHEHGGMQASISEVAALRELSTVSMLTQQELGELLGLEKSTVSRLVSGMEGRGWLIRERDPHNRRFTRLRLTADGRTIAARIGRQLTDRHHALFSALTAAERQAVVVGFTALARALDQLHNDASTPR
jgi:DNA-binding MarR family transcriptional regulator